MQDPRLINEYVFTRFWYWILALKVAKEKGFSSLKTKGGYLN